MTEQNMMADPNEITEEDVKLLNELVGTGSKLTLLLFRRNKKIRLGLVKEAVRKNQINLKVPYVFDMLTGTKIDIEEVREFTVQEHGENILSEFPFKMIITKSLYQEIYPNVYPG